MSLSWAVADLGTSVRNKVSLEKSREREQQISAQIARETKTEEEENENQPDDDPQVVEQTLLGWENAHSVDHDNNAWVPEETVCPECGDRVSAFRLTRHLQEDCLDRLVSCRNPGCKAIMPFMDREEHEKDYCPRIQGRERLMKRAESRSTVCMECDQEIGHSRAKHKGVCPARIVKCRYHDFGCKTEMKALDLAKHENECIVKQRRDALIKQREKAQTETIICPQCEEEVLRRDLKTHSSTTCPVRNVECPHRCGIPNIAAEDLDYHIEEECPVAENKRRLLEKRKQRHVPSFYCAFGCGEFLPEPMMPAHAKLCSDRFVTCECGASIRFKHKDLHKKRDVTYSLFNVPRCIFAVKREGLASLSLERDRKPGLDLCPNHCGKKVPKIHMKQHLSTDCSRRLVTCKYFPVNCSLKDGQMSLALLDKHWEDDCPGAAKEREMVQKGNLQREETSCPLGCGETMIKMNLKTHMELVCVNRMIACIDCGVEVPSNELQDHRQNECKNASLRNVLAAASRERLNLETPWKPSPLVDERPYNETPWKAET